MSSLKDLSPLLIPITALLIPIVAIIAGTTLKIVRLNLLHETIRHLATQGQPIPPELLDKVIDKKSS